MNVRIIDIALLGALVACASPLRAQVTPEPSRILVGSGKTFVLDTASDIERISIASPETAEAVPVNTRSLMINGKAPGETSAIIWLADGSRKEYDVRVAYSAAKLDAAREQIHNEFADSVQITGDASAVYLTGIVKNIFASQRAQAIGSSFGKVVNLLKVEIPPQEQEILLKVRFADVDRSKSMNLGMNILRSARWDSVRCDHRSQQSVAYHQHLGKHCRHRVRRRHHCYAGGRPEYNDVRSARQSSGHRSGAGGPKRIADSG